ncbi:MAG: hypothetical protein A3F11_03980 [Gammaproteobacteria bacterium RIFCSPHIGHO2_12_FULL_37_14]|nr:MAG: hypothetical protein A3F11_03980 [Gammaproteobacteria bacterium RIFCSPHIGHO2_12_FULL_37_14]
MNNIKIKQEWRIKIAILFIFFLPTMTYAFFCPNNFNQINFGDTIEQIQQQCGSPAKQDTKEITPDIPVPQEWNYYVPRTYTLSATNQPQSTLKTQFTFDSSGKAINISVNGLGVPSTNVCNGIVIALGATQDAVKAACGNPTFVNKPPPSSTPTGTPPPKKKMTEFTYNTNPPVILVFENGILKEKK